MKPISVLFFGPSGAGKGTQIQMLMDALKQRAGTDIVYVEMGALLREQVAEGGYSAQLTNAIISAGGLMPGFMPIYLMTKRLVEKFTGAEHIVADGVVRRISQAEAFDEAMRFYGRPEYDVIVLELSEESTLTRLLARGRNDDTEEGIKRRIAWYKADVEPALAVLQEKGARIHRISGEPSPEEVHREILSVLALS
jgi:adenylate kinase